MILSAAPKYKMKIPDEDWRQPFYYVAKSDIVNYFIIVSIIANTIVLAL
jgi:hypothetical protein